MHNMLSKTNINDEENLGGIDARIMLLLALEKQDMRVWPGFFYLRTGASCLDSGKHGYQPSGYKNGRTFLTAAVIPNRKFNFRVMQAEKRFV